MLSLYVLPASFDTLVSTLLVLAFDRSNARYLRNYSYGNDHSVDARALLLALLAWPPRTTVPIPYSSDNAPFRSTVVMLKPRRLGHYVAVAVIGLLG